MHAIVIIFFATVEMCSFDMKFILKPFMIGSTCRAQSYECYSNDRRRVKGYLWHQPVCWSLCCSINSFIGLEVVQQNPGRFLRCNSDLLPESKTNIPRLITLIYMPIVLYGQTIPIHMINFQVTPSFENRERSFSYTNWAELLHKMCLRTKAMLICLSRVCRREQIST